MAHLKAWPKADAVRALMTEEDLAQKVSELSNYRTVETIATFSGSLATPDLMHAWAYLCEAVQEVYPDAKLGKDFGITRVLTTEEREALVISDECSRRYYHPEEYADYSADDMATQV